MGKQPTRWYWAMVLFFLSLSAGATVTVQLYEVMLPSQSQSQEEWQQLVQQGLVRVLEEVGHISAGQENAIVKDAIQHATDFVEQYAYEGEILHIKYSPELVNQLVQKMGHQVLNHRPSSLPKVILWLAIEDNHQRKLVGQETDPSLQTYLQHIAKMKGIPLVLPLMDLEDMSAITVTDVWGQFPTILQQASLRYEANIILLGRLSYTKGRWEGNWEVLGQESSWETQNQTLEQALEKGFSGIIPYLKNTNNHRTLQSKRAPSGRPFLIGIKGVQSSADFTNVENYLKSLNQIADVNIHQLFGTMAIFEITPKESDREALAHALGRDQRLIPSFSSQQEMTEVESTYYWVQTSP